MHLTEKNKRLGCYQYVINNVKKMLTLGNPVMTLRGITKWQTAKSVGKMVSDRISAQ